MVPGLRRDDGVAAVTLKLQVQRRTTRIMATTHPIDTNQIRARIGDLRDRVASLRGYL